MKGLILVVVICLVVAGIVLPAGASRAAQAPATVGGECFDGSRVAAARAALPALEQAKGRIAAVCGGSIWTLQPDGSDPRRLTWPPEVDWSGIRLFRVPRTEPPSAREVADLTARIDAHPLWLGGGRLLFESTRDTLVTSGASGRTFVGATDLFVAAPDGTLTRLTNYNADPATYPFAGGGFPDGCLGETCFAGRVRVQPASATRDGAVVVVEIGEIRFSECCAVPALLDLTSGALTRAGCRSRQTGRSTWMRRWRCCPPRSRRMAAGSRSGS
jgi:hypothetical protein